MEIKKDIATFFQSELRYRGFVVSKAQTKEIINAFVDACYDLVREGVKIDILRFGHFSYRQTGNFTRPGLEEGQRIIVPPNSRIKFTPAKQFKRWVRECDPAHAKTEN